MTHHNTTSAETVARAVIESFGDAVRSVLLFGSAARGNGNDLDLIVTFRGPYRESPSSLAKLADVRSRFPSLRMDLHPLWESDLTAADDFTLHAQGSYLLPILARATVLHGDNPFTGLHPTPTALMRDAVRKGAEYVMRARMAACGGGSTKVDAHGDPWRKNARKMLLDLLIAAGETTEEDVVTRAARLVPGHLTADDQSLITDDRSPLVAADAAPLLHRIHRMQEVLATETGPTRKPSFRNVSGIACEVLLSTLPNGEWIVLCDGMPTVPQRHDLMRDLAALGFHVAHPRYAGTWESRGTFLTASPADDIAAVAQAIARGKFGTTSGPLTLLGSSFGGSVALCAAEAAGAACVVAFSPVTDFRAIPEEMTGLGAHLRDARSGAYRFDDAGWRRLSDGGLLDPAQAVLPPRTTIVAGTDDPQVPFGDVSAYCMRKAVRLVTATGAGHISFARLRERHWGDLMDALGR